MGIKKTFPTEAIERIKELGYRVRLARTRRGMSIAEVAAKAGCRAVSSSASASPAPSPSTPR